MESLNPADVLSYLNMLGYTNISAHQLKEFIRDLKKLVKYEWKHKNNIDVFCFNENTNSGLQILTKNIGKDTDIYEYLHSQSTVSSEAKKTNPLEKHISVQIKKKRHKTLTDNDTESRRVSSNVLEDNKIKPTQILESDSELRHKSCSSVESMKSESVGSKVLTKKSSCSVSSKKVNRRDPVALYQYYQTEWNKNRHKIPGQDDHSDIRWAVREKLMGKPPVEVPLSNRTSCRKVCTQRSEYLL